MLPFDHRGSFEHGLFGWSASLTFEQRAEVSAAKEVIYAALLTAIGDGVSAERAALLVDEEFGRNILLDARNRGLVTACPAEKSGQAEFGFEYGGAFAEHIEAMDPTYCKVLVRYNPEGDVAMNRRQALRLYQLSEYLHRKSRPFLFELLVPPEPVHLAQMTRDRYDSLVRPTLTQLAIHELQEAAVEPDIWKLEGYDRTEDAAAVVAAAQQGSRHGVRCIVLGRHADEDRVKRWLEVAAAVPGFIGFAVGRSTFWDPLVALLEKRITRAEAVARIARRYREWVDVWEAAVHAVGATTTGVSAHP